MNAALHDWMLIWPANSAPRRHCRRGRPRVRARHRIPTGSPTRRAQKAAQTLLGRAGSHEELASLIVWLLGPDGDRVTGQILSPNGGAVLGR